MKKTWLVLVFIPFFLVSCGQKQEEDTTYIEHEYYPVFAKYCSNCHPISRPLGRRYSAYGWEQIVKKMQRKDKNLIPDSEAAKIITFLQETRLSK